MLQTYGRPGAERAAAPGGRRLLCLDMDGTLLDDTGALGAATAEVLGRIRDRGHVVSFVTGRGEIDMFRCRHLYRCADYLLMGNGGKLLEGATGRFLFRRTVPREPARKLIAYCLERELHLYVMMGPRYAVNKVTPGVVQYAEEIGVWPRRFSSVEEIDLDAVESFMVSGDQAAVTRLVAEEGLPLSCVPSEPGCCDILPGGSGKWQGVRRLAGLLGIPVSGILAAGNYDNDIEMIRRAGVGVAVANAPAHVRAAADYVTARTNNEDALVEIASVLLGL